MWWFPSAFLGMSWDRVAVHRPLEAPLRRESVCTNMLSSDRDLCPSWWLKHHHPAAGLATGHASIAEVASQLSPCCCCNLPLQLMHVQHGRAINALHLSLGRRPWLVARLIELIPGPSSGQRTKGLLRESRLPGNALCELPG